ncbi:hypothetical protein LTS17_011509 [Exophiala oligosperma]
MSLGDNENTTATVDIKALETALEIETAHEADSAAERHVIRKIDTYLLPMLSFMLLVAFLDRTNIGNAKIGHCPRSHIYSRSPHHSLVLVPRLLAYAIAHMDNVGGYGAWRWIFILEGIITVFVAIVAFFLLPDWPHQAKFLSDDERNRLLQMLSRDTRDYVETKTTFTVMKDCLKDMKVYMSALIYFGTAITGSSSGYFLPTILHDLGWTAIKAQYMSIPVWITAWAISIVVGYCSDKTKHRYGFVMGPLCFCLVGYAILLAQKSVVVGVRFMAVFFLVGGCFASITISLTWLNNNIVGSRRRGISTAIMLAVGNCGSIVGSNVYLASEAPWYPTGYSVSLAGVVISQVCATIYLLHVRRENKAKERGERDAHLSLTREEQDALADKHVNYRYTY